MKPHLKILEISDLALQLTGEAEASPGSLRIREIPHIPPAPLEIHKALPLRFSLPLCRPEVGLLCDTFTFSLCETIAKLSEIILRRGRGIKPYDALLILVSPEGLQDLCEARLLLFTLTLYVLEIIYPGSVPLDLALQSAYGIGLAEDILPEGVASNLLSQVVALAGQVLAFLPEPLDLCLNPAEVLKCFGRERIDLGDFLERFERLLPLDEDLPRPPEGLEVDDLLLDGLLILHRRPDRLALLSDRPVDLVVLSLPPFHGADLLFDIPQFRDKGIDLPDRPLHHIDLAGSILKRCRGLPDGEVSGTCGGQSIPDLVHLKCRDHLELLKPDRTDILVEDPVARTKQ